LLRPTRDQPSPTSVLDITFDEISGTELDSSHSLLTSYQRKYIKGNNILDWYLTIIVQFLCLFRRFSATLLETQNYIMQFIEHYVLFTEPPLSRSSAIESVARTLSWDEKCLATPKKHPQLLRTSSEANKDEQEFHSFVEKLLSSSGYDTQRTHNVLSRWYSLESPLNPTLLDTFLDPKEEAAKCRERRSNQKLLFDCVNLALLQIGHYILKNSYPWSNHHKGLQDGLLISEVWRLVRNLISNEGKFVPEERENASLIVERAVKKEVKEREWTESMEIEVDEISKEIGGVMLDDLVAEALTEFAILCS
jgi:Domain of unknown function (DUF4378)